jgi:hypothetical protein
MCARAPRILRSSRDATAAILYRTLRRRRRAIFGVIQERRFAASEGQRPIRLIALREDFRRMVRPEHLGVVFLWATDRDAEVARLVVWLLGRTHAQAAIPEIVTWRGHTDVRLRREVARALARLNAWAELRTMAATDTDPRVIRLASGRAPKPLSQRLARARISCASPAHRSASFPVFARQPLGPGRAARSAEMLRAILERIRLRVRGR